MPDSTMHKCPDLSSQCSGSRKRHQLKTCKRGGGGGGNNRMGGNCWIDWKTSCDSAVKKGNEYSKLAKHMLRVGHLVLVELSTGAMIGRATQTGRRSV